jgi:hypothetical protein
MKKIFIFTFVLLSFNLFSQNQSNGFCGTKDVKSEWLKKFQANLKSGESPESGDTLFVPLTVHLLGNDDSTGFYSLSALLDDICTLNKDFQAAKVQFFLPEPPNYIANTKWNNHKTYEEGADMFDENVPNTINCFIGVSAAGNCGYDYQGTGISLARACVGKYNHTWAHEMGHELSLPHTFYGWEGQNYDFDKKPPLILLFGEEVELLNKSNCKKAGDGFCDTESDYISNRWTCGANQRSNQDYTDPNGEKFKVRGDYFMSYSNDACMDKFSEDQIRAMRAHLNEEKTDFLAEKNPYKPLGSQVLQLLPLDSLKSNDSKIKFSWTSVKNASDYFLEVSRTSNFDQKEFSGIVKDTSKTLQLKLGKKYYWRVKAFNLGFSCNESKRRILNIIDPTSINEVFKLDEFLVFPNPANSDENLTIQFNAEFSEKAKIEMFDISGKLLKMNDLQINQGQNTISFSTGFSSGFYLLKVKTRRGEIVEKIVIAE